MCAHNGDAGQHIMITMRMLKTTSDRVTTFVKQSTRLGLRQSKAGIQDYREKVTCWMNMRLRLISMGLAYWPLNRCQKPAQQPELPSGTIEPRSSLEEFILCPCKLRKIISVP